MPFANDWQSHTPTPPNKACSRPLNRGGRPLVSGQCLPACQPFRLQRRLTQAVRRRSWSVAMNQEEFRASNGVVIETDSIVDWLSFHDRCAAAFGFPAIYGRKRAAMWHAQPP